MRDLEMKLNAIKVQLISKCHLSTNDLTRVFSYISDILYSKLTVREYTQLDKRECTYTAFTICGTEYELYGRVGDVINDEIGMAFSGAKEYTEHVNTTLSEADMIRSQVLMQMMEIETCRFDTPTGVTNITRDCNIWKYEIETKLRRFCEYVHSRLSKST